MKDKKGKKNDLQLERWLRAAAIILIIAGLLTALWVNAQRVKAEADYQVAGLMVDYDELTRCAQAQGITFEDAARKAYKAGATGIIVRERILDDWVKAGQLAIQQGTEVKLQLKSGLLAAAPDLAVQETATYLFTENQAVYDQIFKLLEAKRRHPQALEIGTYKVIQANLYSGELSFLGVGYPLQDLQTAVNLGMNVVVRIRNWAPVNQENIQTAIEAVSKIPGLAGIGFNDESLPGGDNPQALNYLAEAIRPLNVPLVSFEFYGQAGLESLAGLLDNQVVRAHAIADNELKKYNVAQALDRFRLAASERNIRYIYLRFFGMDQPVAALESNLEYIKEVKAGLIEEGFALGQPKQLNMAAAGFAAKWILGLSVLAAGAWLLAEAAAPVCKKRWLLPYSGLCILAAGAWTFLLLWRSVLAVKLMALCAAIAFPSLSILLILKKDVRQKPGRSLAAAAVDLIKMSAVTLAGAMIMCALLKDTRFMLKLDGFAGIKIAHIIPLVLVPLALWLREQKPKKLMYDMAGTSVKFWHLAVGGLILVALVIYILRTGNTGVSSVSSLELQFRQLLDSLLGVRPRTKEFAIGHPMMLLLLYYGYRFNMYAVLLLGIIGQVSLMNTYAHIHTPLLISLFRSFNGLWLGLLLGLGLVLLIKLLCRLAGISQRKGTLDR